MLLNKCFFFDIRFKINEWRGGGGGGPFVGEPMLCSESDSGISNNTFGFQIRS